MGMRVEQYYLSAMGIVGSLPLSPLVDALPVPIPPGGATPASCVDNRIGVPDRQLGPLPPSGEFDTISGSASSDNIYLMMNDEYLAGMMRQGLDASRFALREQVQFHYAS